MTTILLTTFIGIVTIGVITIAIVIYNEYKENKNDKGHYC